MGADRSAGDEEVGTATSDHRDDHRLLQRVVGGDRDAQQELAARLLPLCRRICRTLIRDPIDADDATHVALLEILRSVASYRAETAVEGWAQRIVVRSAMRFVKGRRRSGERKAHQARVSQIRAPSLGGARMLDELPRPLESYLEEVPEAQREALLLRHALGHSMAEIAEITGVSPNTVKSRLLHGRRALRRLIRRDLQLGIGNAVAGA